MEYLYFRTRWRRRLGHIWRLGLWALLCWGAAQGVSAYGAQEELARQVVRFHVLADSDTPEAQAVKEDVRDAILAYLGPGLESAGSRAEALDYLEGQLGHVQAVAQEVLQGQGLDLPVTVSLAKELFPTKAYGSLTFPAGRYLALRVNLGSGSGRNWWCVLYPSLCLTGAAAQDGTADAGNQAVLSAVLSPEAMALLTETEGTPVFRFKLIEWWEGLGAGPGDFATRSD